MAAAEEEQEVLATAMKGALRRPGVQEVPVVAAEPMMEEAVVARGELGTKMGAVVREAQERQTAEEVGLEHPEPEGRCWPETTAFEMLAGEVASCRQVAADPFSLLAWAREGLVFLEWRVLPPKAAWVQMWLGASERKRICPRNPVPKDRWHQPTHPCQCRRGFSSISASRRQKARQAGARTPCPM